MLSTGFSHPTRLTAYELFTPNKSGQRLHPTYYRGCWHVVSRCFFCRYRHFRFFPAESGLQPEGLHPARGVAASGFRPLRNIPHCCLPYESGPCLSPSVAGRPLRPATRRRLGEPLPHQLADRPRAHPRPKNFPTPQMPAEFISGISASFEELSRSLGQVAHVLLTRSPLIQRSKLRFHRSTCMC